MQEKQFDQQLKAALNTSEAPAPEVNAILKARLYQREKQLQLQSDRRSVSLWWLPMVANLIVCGVPAIVFALPTMPLVAHLAAFALGWLALGGVVLTLVGLKCSNLKEQLRIDLPSRGRREAL